jgi:hypothetical protein
VPVHHQLAELDAAGELLAWHNVEFATKRNGFGGLDARLAFNTPLHVRHIENLANMAKQGLFVYKGRGNAADATFVSGECAMTTGSSALYGKHQAQRQVRLGIWHPALLPRRAGRAAEHRDRRRQPVGDGRQEAAEYKGVAAVLQLPVQAPRCRQPATSAPATCRSPGRLRADREVGFYKQNPGTDVAVNADDPQDHRQVARHPPGQLRADPHHHRRRTRAGLGRQEERQGRRWTPPSSAATSCWSASKKANKCAGPESCFAAMPAACPPVGMRRRHAFAAD